MTTICMGENLSKDGVGTWVLAGTIFPGGVFTSLIIFLS